jgi:hypothetical protein
VEGQVELFKRAREFLAAQGMARNVRIADVVAVLDNPITGTVNAGQQLDAVYSGPGSYPGPLDNQGNMPTSSMGVIIGSAVLAPRPWVATEEPGIEQTYQAIAQDTTHLVHVAGTDVLARHSTFSTRYASLFADVAAGPIYGIPAGSADLERTPEPTLVVGKGERVQQRLIVRRDIVLGNQTITPELALLLVVADEGTD